MRDRLTYRQKERLMRFVAEHPFARLETVVKGAVHHVWMVHPEGRHRTFLFRRDTAKGESRVNPFALSRGFREYIALTKEAMEILMLCQKMRGIIEERGARRARAEADAYLSLLQREIDQLRARIRKDEEDDRAWRAARFEKRSLK